MKYVLFVLITSLLCSCHGKDYYINQIVSKYDKENFDILRGKSVYFETKGSQLSSDIYLIKRHQDKCQPYIVEYSPAKKQVIKINRRLVVKSCKQDYFSNEELVQAAKKFSKYRMYLIKVNQDGNVYMNPFENQHPVLVRKSINSNLVDTINTYKKYKNNWFIRKG